MSDAAPTERPDRPDGPSAKKDSAVPSSPSQAPSGIDGAKENPPTAALTPEEQMALYEKELKETDWGHQPC
jgi:hypothetical protein